MKILICSFWETACYCLICVCHRIQFRVPVHLILGSPDTGKLTHIRTLHSRLTTHLVDAAKSVRGCQSCVFFKIICFLFISDDHRLRRKLWFLILRVIFNRPVLSVQVAQIFVVLRVLVVVERIQALVGLDGHVVQPR